MKCPICGSDMISGDVICKVGAGPTLYPKNPEAPEWKHVMKLMFGSKDSIRSDGLDEGWYCKNCEKILVIWNEKKPYKSASAEAQDNES